MEVAQLIHEISRYGASVGLSLSWDAVVINHGFESLPEKLRQAVATSRDEIAAYLVGLELLRWLERWEPREDLWIN